MILLKVVLKHPYFSAWLIVIYLKKQHFKQY